MVQLGNHWQELLSDEFEKDYYKKLRAFLKDEYLGSHPYRVFPPMNNIFTALRLTDYDDVKVVILGQDPYHEYGQAHGLAFSVPEGVTVPPSLCNIYKELSGDLGITPPQSGCLIPWAKSGVLLLNDVLTVREGAAGSHDGIGWQYLTSRIIQLLNEREKPMVFMLWGAYARRRMEPSSASRSLAEPMMILLRIRSSSMNTGLNREMNSDGHSGSLMQRIRMELLRSRYSRISSNRFLSNPGKSRIMFLLTIEHGGRTPRLRRLSVMETHRILLHR